jgi:hypothetical protein
MRDIREPGAAINPEHVGFTVMKKDGSEVTAVLLGENARGATLALPGALPLEIPRADIASMKPLAASLMPAGLDKALAPEQLRDLMSYLLLPPLEPAPLMQPGAPPPRKLAEVKAILGDTLDAAPAPNAKPLRIVLCASAKDGGHSAPGVHDYPIWRTRWTRLLSLADGITAEPANDWPSPDQWQHADIIAFNSFNPVWAREKDPAKLAQLGEDIDRFLARGGGLVFIHYALNARDNAPQLASRLGHAWSPTSRFRHGARDWVLDKNHPLAAGFTSFQIPDESYWNMAGDLAASGAQVLATSQEENAPRPQMWTRESGAGRVFVSVPGHYTWTYDDPLYRILVLRGMMWTARQLLDRLSPLSVIGARVE